MRQGCISLGETRCDKCGRVVPHAERYLIVDEENDEEVEKGQLMHYCIDCAQKKGYAHYREEKGEKVLTFFPESKY